jgi:prolyl oligopeptidase
MPLTAIRFSPVEEMIHGVLVQDPYRWLEDRSLTETEDWVREQQRRCDRYFANCEGLAAIRSRVRQCCDVEVIDQPARIGSLYFYRRRSPGQEQACIHVRDAVTGMDRLLIDPSADGPFVSVSIYRISADGRMLAYEGKQGGEDKSSIHVADVSTGTSLPRAIDRGYARGFAFLPDNRGFFYCHDVGDNGDHTIEFQDFDNSAVRQVVFRVPRSQASRLTLLADSVHLGAVRIHKVDGELVEDLWISEKRDPTNWRRALMARRLPFNPILAHGRLFGLRYGRRSLTEFVELTLDGDEVRTIIQAERSMIRQLTIAGQNVYICCFTDSGSTLRASRMSGEHLPELTLPEQGTIELLPNLGDGTSLFLSYESCTCPPTIWEHVPDSGALFAWTERSPLDTTCSVATKHSSYRSFDGTEIPITLVSSMAAKISSPVPIIMTSDGGFGAQLTPRFSVLVSMLLECGAVFVIPAIRGSGAPDRAWHEAARGRCRQNSFDDFIAAAEWLCREGISTPQQIAIFGSSNAGLLVGVALTQRPDLFRAVVCISPLLDMLRYEHFDQGKKWEREYGSCENEEDFRALYAYSPYHHISATIEYPSVLFIAGDRDDRCNPAHVRKMAARLLENADRDSSIFVDYTAERGHVPVMPLTFKIEALARRIAFLCRELRLPFPRGADYDVVCD